MSRTSFRHTELCKQFRGICDGLLHKEQDGDYHFDSKSTETAVKEVMSVNDFIGWLVFHHELAHFIYGSNYEHFTVLYSDVVRNPLNMIKKIAKFVGFTEDDLHDNN